MFKNIPPTSLPKLYFFVFGGAAFIASRGFSFIHAYINAFIKKKKIIQTIVLGDVIQH